MQKQYKLYKIDKDKVAVTIPHLNKYKYKKLSENIVAIEYDYLNNGYKELLESMSKMATTQYIITTSLFYKLLSFFVKKGLDIYEVELNALFEQDNDSLHKYIREINQKKDDDNTVNTLLEVLKWYNYDEGIDINHMTFGMKSGNRNCRFHFYNNGVLAIDSEEIENQLFELLKDVL